MLLVCRFNGSDRDGKDGKTGVYEMMHGKETITTSTHMQLYFIYIRILHNYLICLCGIIEIC